MINCNQLAAQLTEKYGLPVVAAGRNTTDGYQVTIRPSGVERTISFIIEIIIGWRSIEAKFSPANFASALVTAMQNATEDQQSAFLTFTKSTIEKGGDININISGLSVEPLELSVWPVKWTSIDISLRKSAIVIDPENEESIIKIINPWIDRFFGIIVALLPLEEESLSIDSCGEEEGAEFEFKSKRYERSKINRAACIEIHGLNCHICGTNFESTYGELGKGFIHVHHITPVSTMESSYVIKPGTDLIPVCPNCHSMLHRESPPVTIDRLIRIVKQII